MRQPGMVHLFRSPLEIKGPYQADGFIFPTSMYPSLPYQVRLPKDHAGQALIRIAEAQAAGPAGAEEAERGTEVSPCPHPLRA